MRKAAAAAAVALQKWTCTRRDTTKQTNDIISVACVTKRAALSLQSTWHNETDSWDNEQSFERGYYYSCDEEDPIEHYLGRVFLRDQFKLTFAIIVK